MPLAPRRLPLNAPERLAALRKFQLTDPAPHPAFERLAQLAQNALGAPVCLVSMVDDQAQYFKAAIGLGGDAARTRKTPLSHSFCQHVVSSARPLIVEDARINPLVRANLAVRDLSVIAYLGVPILSPEGIVLGSFCVIDSHPRLWQQHEIDLLLELSRSVTQELVAQENSAAPASPPPDRGPLPTPAALACLDNEVVEECRQLPGRDGRTLLADVAQIYLSLEPARLTQLTALAQSGDLPSCASIAHIMAGSCASLGAQHAQALLLGMEKAAKAGDLTRVREHLAQLPPAMEQVRLAAATILETPALTRALPTQ